MCKHLVSYCAKEHIVHVYAIACVRAERRRLWGFNDEPLSSLFINRGRLRSIDGRNSNSFLCNSLFAAKRCNVPVTYMLQMVETDDFQFWKHSIIMHPPPTCLATLMCKVKMYVFPTTCIEFRKQTRFKKCHKCPRRDVRPVSVGEVFLVFRLKMPGH